MKTFARAALLCSLVLIAPPALAEDKKGAAESFRTGAAAYAKKDYRAAALSFEMAHKLSPAAAALYNAGIAWDDAKEPARAADALEAAFLAPGELDDKQRADSLARLARLRKGLGRLSVTGEGALRFSVEHAERRAPPAKVFLPPGEHVVLVEVGASAGKRSVTITAGKETALELSGAEAPKPAPGPSPSDPPAAPPPAERPKADEGGGLSAQAGVGIAFGALALGGGAAAIGLGVAALGARDEFVASGNADAAAHDRADALRLGTNVAWAAAGAMAITSAVLLATAPWGKRAPKKTGLRLVPTATGLAGRF